MTALPPSELDCPDPPSCPVIEDVRDWSVTRARFDARTWYRVYEGKFGYDEYNPGFGDTRFAPFGAATGARVPSIYLAANETAALLETIFHSVDETTSHSILTEPTVSEEDLRDRLVVAMSSPATARLADFRDSALGRLGVARRQLITSPWEHYPCTRRTAATVHADSRTVDGIIWHSRQAELTGHGQIETVVLFGDRHVNGRGLWKLAEAGMRSLYEGTGRELAERIAVELGVRIIPLVNP